MKRPKHKKKPQAELPVGDRLREVVSERLAHMALELEPSWIDEVIGLFQSLRVASMTCDEAVEPISKAIAARLLPPRYDKAEPR